MIYPDTVITDLKFFKTLYTCIHFGCHLIAFFLLILFRIKKTPRVKEKASDVKVHLM